MMKIILKKAFPMFKYKTMGRNPSMQQMIAARSSWAGNRQKTEENVTDDEQEIEEKNCMEETENIDQNDNDFTM